MNKSEKNKRSKQKTTTANQLTSSITTYFNKAKEMKQQIQNSSSLEKLRTATSPPQITTTDLAIDTEKLLSSCPNKRKGISPLSSNQQNEAYTKNGWDQDIDDLDKQLETDQNNQERYDTTSNNEELKNSKKARSDKNRKQPSVMPQHNQSQSSSEESASVMSVDSDSSSSSEDSSLINSDSDTNKSGNTITVVASIKEGDDGLKSVSHIHEEEYSESVQLETTESSDIENYVTQKDLSIQVVEKDESQVQLEEVAEPNINQTMQKKDIKEGTEGLDKGKEKEDNRISQTKAVPHNQEKATTENSSAFFSPKIINSENPSKSQESTDEDDINTISSDKTSHKLDKKLAIRVVAPTSTRYQFVLELREQAQDELEQLIGGNPSKEDLEQIQKTEIYLKIRTHIMKLYEKMIAIEPQAVFITWKEKGDFEILAPETEEDFPEEPDELARYFDGILTKKKKGKVYIRLRIHSSRREDTSFEASLASWAIAHNYNFNKCLIQAESMKNIGWIIYSTSATDTDHLSRYLTNKTGIEWGFRMAPITDSDKSTPFPKRKKALNVYVPTGKADMAIACISQLFVAGTEKGGRRPFWSTRYIFSLSEWELAAIPDAATLKYFKTMVDRHTAQYNLMQNKTSITIRIDLDAPIYTETVIGNRTTLREIILHLKSHREGPFKGSYLFHAVDFCPDLSKAWLKTGKYTERGTGGQGHIFSFLKPFTAEASAMIKGLGVYMIATYGKEIIENLFTVDHWYSNKEWYWDAMEKSFQTPESKIMRDNLQFDPYAIMVQKMDEIEEKEKAEKDTEREQVDIAQIVEKQQAENSKAMVDKDLMVDPNMKLPPEVQQVQIGSQTSVASTMTKTTDNSALNDRAGLTVENVHEYFDKAMTFDEQKRALHAKFELDNRRRTAEFHRLQEALEKQATNRVNNKVLDSQQRSTEKGTITELDYEEKLLESPRANTPTVSPSKNTEDKAKSNRNNHNTESGKRQDTKQRIINEGQTRHTLDHDTKVTQKSPQSEKNSIDKAQRKNKGRGQFGRSRHKHKKEHNASTPTKNSSKKPQKKSKNKSSPIQGQLDTNVHKKKEASSQNAGNRK